jgi:hypothetical protein
MRLLRRTRETHRHERAVVLQQKAESQAAALPVDAWKAQQVIECARMALARGRMR